MAVERSHTGSKIVKYRLPKRGEITYTDPKREIQTPKRGEITKREIQAQSEERSHEREWIRKRE